MPNRLRLVRIALLGLLAAAATAAPAPVHDADLYVLWRAGDIARMEQLAERGDVRAQRWMGLMLHQRGESNEAIEWYARAVAQGDGASANDIAFFYELGIGRPVDRAQAVSWYRRGAALGDFTSQVRYASALRSGDIVPRDERSAFAWYRRAAAQRDQEQPGYAYLPLAEIYAEGTAVPRDLERAWAYAKAAELTVDDSDTRSVARARDLQRDLAARLRPDARREAERLFAAHWPDLARRSAGWSAIPFVALVVLLAGLVRLFWREWRRAA